MEELYEECVEEKECEVEEVNNAQEQTEKTQAKGKGGLVIKDTRRWSVFVSGQRLNGTSHFTHFEV